MSGRKTVGKGGKVLPQVEKGKSAASRHFLDLKTGSERKLREVRESAKFRKSGGHFHVGEMFSVAGECFFFFGLCF